MNNDNVLQAILLLCSFFNKNESRNIKPLTPTEYSRLATWLHQNKYTPADFILREEELLTQWQDPKNKITRERLAQLLQRAASMGFAMEKWQQQNVWVLSRASEEYPGALRRLGDTRSPLLYGIGNQSLLNTQGIGFVGSRDTNSDDDAFTKSLAQKTVERGFTVVSGGAKGVDQASMQAALDAGGYAIGVLADSLLKAATKPQYRKALQEGRLLLITPYYPEASFNAGNAMGRNKYIYTLSQGVVVAKADEKGGTWSGAIENLKKRWVPLWVRYIEKSGNQKLIELGGQPINTVDVDFSELIKTFDLESVAVLKGDKNKKTTQEREETQEDLSTGDMFSPTEQKEPEVGSNTDISAASDQKISEQHNADNEPKLSSDDLVAKEDRAPAPESTQSPAVSMGTLGTFLDFFYQQIKQESEKTYTPKALAEEYPELSETIVKQWLKTLEESGLVKRQGRKLAYKLTEGK